MAENRRPHPQTPSPQAGRGQESRVPWRTPPELWEKLRPLARQMRREPTPAEDRLWQRLRKRQVLRLKFRRQHAIDRFIVDFYCAEAGLVVEIDGPIHAYRQEEDSVRQEFLESLGLRVLQFRNQEVLDSLDGVVDQIVAALPAGEPTPESTPATTPLPASGEGQGEG